MDPGWRITPNKFQGLGNGKGERRIHFRTHLRRRRKETCQERTSSNILLPKQRACARRRKVKGLSQSTSQLDSDDRKVQRDNTSRNSSINNISDTVIRPRLSLQTMADRARHHVRRNLGIRPHLVHAQPQPTTRDPQRPGSGSLRDSEIHAPPRHRRTLHPTHHPDRQIRHAPLSGATRRGRDLRRH